MKATSTEIKTYIPDVYNAGYELGTGTYKGYIGIDVLVEFSTELLSLIEGETLEFTQEHLLTIREEIVQDLKVFEAKEIRIKYQIDEIATGTQSDGHSVVFIKSNFAEDNRHSVHSNRFIKAKMKAMLTAALVQATLWKTKQPMSIGGVKVEPNAIIVPILQFNKKLYELECSVEDIINYYCSKARQIWDIESSTDFDEKYPETKKHEYNFKRNIKHKFIKELSI